MRSPGGAPLAIYFGVDVDVTDEEWALVAPCLTLMSEDAPQRTYSLREVFNGLRWIVRAGAPRCGLKLVASADLSQHTMPGVRAFERVG
jgi:hypothetical protein